MNADFIDLVNREYEKLQRGEPCFYIGEGNPDANILIIGNECAIGDGDYRLEGDAEFQSLTNPTARMLRKEKVIAEHNVRKWKYIIERNNVVENLYSDLYLWHYGTDTEVSELLQKDRHRFYPLFPEFGQKCTTGKGGTARTWVRYQQLINGAVGDICGSGEARNLIDFHHFCFHTELSQIPLKSSNMANTALTRESVQLRMEQLFNHPFFSKFPVIIIAAGHYVDKYVFKNNDGQYDDKKIIETFNVAYDRPCGRKGAWMHIHHGCNNYNSPYLLLHTCHLASHRVGLDYIDEIAAQIYDTIGAKIYLHDTQSNGFVFNIPTFGKRFEITSPYDFGKAIFPFAMDGTDALLCECGHCSHFASIYDLLPGNTYAVIKNGIIKYKTDTAEIIQFYPQKEGNEYKNITAYDVKEYVCRDSKIAECLREIECGEIETLTGQVIKNI